ncbi:MAG TPA: hypothetical protein VGO67_19370 [Verrucomicrobiae bacterium]|jgi:hypothetical protein
MKHCGRRISKIIPVGIFLVLLTRLAFADPAGPTLQLANGQNGESTNSTEAFMYFVPLISPEPLSIVISPGGNQSARLTAATHKVSGNSFTASCEINFTGAGSQKSLFDLSHIIQRHEQALKGGSTIVHQVKSIALEGNGVAMMEVSGAITNGTSSVNEVRLRFNTHGQASPVTIEMCDIKYADGDYKQVNGVVAKVNTLTFRRQTNTPKMEVSVDSLKKVNASDSLWQSFKGKVEGVAVNMFLPPLPIEEAGNRAMMDFGLALISGSPTYTFPLAKNLKPPTAR